jgi:hypothetical protein
VPRFCRNPVTSATVPVPAEREYLTEGSIVNVPQRDDSRVGPVGNASVAYGMHSNAGVYSAAWVESNQKGGRQ